jgi:DNA-binding NarL/FixJ family response regulator
MTAPPSDATDVTPVRAHGEALPPPAVEDRRSSLLIADDDAVVRYRLTSALANDFRIVAIAENATDAIALAAEHQPDAALIDVQMPGGGARAAVPAIVAASPRTRMVILSADEIQHEVVELLNAGAIAYVRKGVAGESIAQTLAQALRVDI